MIEGKGGISAKVVADSVANNVRLTTLQLRYPRFIHAEFMTHRMFSRNAASNRAIPTRKSIEQVISCPAEPIHWGLNQKGMQASKELEDSSINAVSDFWFDAMDYSATMAENMVEFGVHKQVVNRLLEPFQFIDVLVTATEWDNFFNLRLHEDAQPEIYELARVMKEAMNNPEGQQCHPSGWHTPYITETDIMDFTSDVYTLAKVSAGRCARVSYKNHDKSEPDPERDLDLANRLLEAGHMSPFEHQARRLELYPTKWENIYGVTHKDERDNFWSNNFREWIQYRALLDE